MTLFTVSYTDENNQNIQCTGTWDTSLLNMSVEEFINRCDIAGGCKYKATIVNDEEE